MEEDTNNSPASTTTIKINQLQAVCIKPLNQFLHTKLKSLESKLVDYEQDKLQLKDLTTNYAGVVKKVELLEKKLIKLQAQFNIYKRSKKSKKTSIVQDKKPSEDNNEDMEHYYEKVDYQNLEEPIKSEPNSPHPPASPTTTDNDKRDKEFDDNISLLLPSSSSSGIESEEEKHQIDNNSKISSSSSLSINFHCPSCPKKYKSKPSLVRHEIAVHYPVVKPFKCKICMIQFGESNLLGEHMQRKHPSSSTTNSTSKTTTDKTTNILACKLCSSITTAPFDTDIDLATHYTTHHTSDHILTSAGLKNKRKFLRHVVPSDRVYTTSLSASSTIARQPKAPAAAAKVRLRQPTFACPYCRISRFPTKLQMKLHTAHCVTLKNLSCSAPDCKDKPRFTDKEELLTHNQVVHPKSIYSCSECAKTFVFADNLKEHVNSAHKGIKPYLCAECGHTTPYRSSYVQHVKSHEGRRDYECSVCKKGFSSKGVLKRHLERIHKMVD